MNYLLLITLGLRILFVFLIAILLVILLLYLTKLVQKDLDTLNYLKKRSKEVSTKKEIEDFYEEFLEKASKINNNQIQTELMEIKGYLKGIYKQYKS